MSHCGHKAGRFYSVTTPYTESSLENEIIYVTRILLIFLIQHKENKELHVYRFTPATTENVYLAK